MALRFLDSFAHYTAASGLRSKYNFVAGAWSVPVAGGWPGGKAARPTQSTAVIRKTLDDQATWIIGLRFQAPSLQDRTILYVVDNGTVQVELRLEIDGTISAWRSAGTGRVRLGKGNLPITAGVWVYLEWRVTINNATGAVHTRINGQDDLDLSGIDTSASGNPFANVIGLCWDVASGGDGIANSLYGDLYVCDAAGAINNDFLGDVRVEMVLPTGSGTYTQWAPVGQPTNWQAVSQNPPIPGTDYVTSATPGQKDSYAHATAGAGVTVGTVYGLSVTIDAEKDDAGFRSIAGLVRLGTTDDLGANIALGNSPVIVEDIHETDPSGAAWTIANVNAAEIGVEEVT